MILLDGAHNPAGMKMLSNTLQNDFEYDKLIVIFGVLQDKNIIEMLDSILPFTDELIFTKSENPRASDPESISEIAKTTRFKGKSKVIDTISDAVQFALISAKKSDMICITGSLFTVGEARTYLLKNQNLLRDKITK